MQTPSVDIESTIEIYHLSRFVQLRYIFSSRSLRHVDIDQMKSRKSGISVNAALLQPLFGKVSSRNVVYYPFSKQNALARTVQKYANLESCRS